MNTMTVPVGATPDQNLPHEQRSKWVALGAGVLAGVLALVPLAVAALIAVFYISLLGGGTLGGYGEAAQSPDAAWVPVAAIAVYVAALAADICIGVAVARRVRRSSPGRSGG